MKYLITGINGFIGSNLAKKLVEQNHEVRGLIRAREREETDESNLKEFENKIDKIYGDITNPETINRMFDGIDVVIHLAARTYDWGPEKLFWKINFEGSKNVLDAAVVAKVKRFVFVSSLTVHGFEGFQHSDEKTPYNPYNAYARSKKAVEDLLNEYFEQSKIEIVIIRPGFTIFGPNDRLLSFEAFQRIENGKPFPTVNMGKNLMCYSYVENLVDGIILVATHPEAAGQTYIISDGPIIPFRDLLKGIFEAAEQEVKLSSFPSWLAFPLATLLEVLYKIGRSKNGPPITKYRVKVSMMDLGFVNDKITQELGYNAEIDIEEAWNRTYKWYKEDRGMRAQ